MLLRKFKEYKKIKQQTNELLNIMTRNELLVIINDFEILLRLGGADID